MTLSLEIRVNSELKTVKRQDTSVPRLNIIFFKFKVFKFYYLPEFQKLPIRLR